MQQSLRVPILHCPCLWFHYYLYPNLTIAEPFFTSRTQKQRFSAFLLFFFSIIYFYVTVTVTFCDFPLRMRSNCRTCLPTFAFFLSFFFVYCHGVLLSSVSLLFSLALIHRAATIGIMLKEKEVFAMGSAGHSLDAYNVSGKCLFMPLITVVIEFLGD